MNSKTLHLWIPLLMALAALFVAVTDSYYVDEGGRAGEALILALIMGAIYLFLLIDHRRRQTFLDWLLQNQEAVMNATRLYRGTPISKDTEVVSYQACLSFFVVTATAPSRFFVGKQGYRGITRLVFSLVTCLLGWWAIPWGPIYTFRALVSNARGGHEQKVLQLFEIPNAV